MKYIGIVLMFIVLSLIAVGIISVVKDNDDTI